MNANKDEAVRCIQLAQKWLAKDERRLAKKFLLKARRLDPSVDTGGMESLLRDRSVTPTSGTGYEAKSQEDVSNSQQNYTKSQVEAVRRVLNCNDYYELFGLPRSCSEDEIKKAYRTLALKFHPDKNHAPGATEAFKKIGSACNVLTDPERRRRYDQFGTDEEQAPRITQVHRHGDAFFQYDADVFTMFFNGGFPFSHAYREHRHRHQRSRESERENNYFVYVQLIPLFILFGLSFFSNLFVKEPVYNLARSNKYYIEHHTKSHNIPYYVKKTFDQDLTGSISQLESQIEEEYVGNLRTRCFREKEYRETLLFRARYYGDDVNFDKAMQLSMPHCERLAQMLGG